MAQRLTAKMIERRRSPKGDAPVFLWDNHTTGLGVKFTPAGKRIFVLQARFPGAAIQAKRTLGAFPAMGVEEARAKAAEWRTWLASGIDPAEGEARKAAKLADEARAARVTGAMTVERVAEAYIEEHLSDKRRGKDDAREIRKWIIPAWRDRPVTSITPQDVKELIRPIARRTPTQAHVIFSHVKRIWSWAINSDQPFGIVQGPAQLLKPRALIGEKRVRTRTLDADELAAFWRACGRSGYPYGDMLRLVVLTGARITEASDASWDEFNLADKTWTVPAERFKSGQAHVVPLSDEACALIEALPKSRGFVFSTTDGEKPISGFSKYKSRFDLVMAEELIKLNEERGTGNGKFRAFVVHDIRRTVRTGLSELGIAPEVAELVIGHGKKGLARVYDQAQHSQAKREALRAWARHLLEIVEPASPANVVKLKPKRK